jgi:hypothetical protein
MSMGVLIGDMPLASPWYESSTVWSVAGVAAVVVMGLATILVTYLVGTSKRSLTYTIWPPIPLRGYLPTNDNEIQIVWAGQILTDPHLAKVTLRLQGRRDISSADWDGNRPLIIDAKVPIISLIEAESLPRERSVPELTIAGTTLTVGPGLIVKDQTLTFDLLVDGRPQLALKSNLIDVRLLSRPGVTLPFPHFKTIALSGLVLNTILAVSTTLVLLGQKWAPAIILFVPQVAFWVFTRYLVHIVRKAR